jgi:hypothetical protein
MSKLIALFAVAVMVAGVRQVIAPGDELPELTDHDVQELKKSGCIKDLAEEADAERATAKAEKAASADFEREKKAITAAQASIAPKAAGKK